MRTWTWGMAAAAVVMAAPAGARAQERTPAPADSGRKAVDAVVARSGAFRDTVNAQLGEMGFDYSPPRRSRLAERFHGGVTVTVSQPVGQFRQYARAGFGVSLAGVGAVDRGGVLGLRVEGGAQNYGRFSAPFRTDSRFVGAPGRQVTSNDVYWGAVGPQLTLPLGPVRPYGFATVGVANFATTSRLLGAGITGAGQEFATSTDLSNWATTQALGGGLRLRLARQSGTAVHLDLGAQRHYVREARYLTPGALPGETPFRLLSTAGRADFLTYHVGVTVGGR